MRPDKLKERRRQKALALVASLGVDTSGYVDHSAERLDRAPENLERQGEAALAFLARPSRFVTKQCTYCQEYFGTNYNSVGYCSNLCRDKHFRQQTGYKVDWGAKSDKERWGGEPPLIIDPETLRHLAQWYTELKQKVDQESQTQSQQQEPEQSQLNTLTIPNESLAPSFEFEPVDLSYFADA